MKSKKLSLSKTSILNLGKQNNMPDFSKLNTDLVAAMSGAKDIKVSSSSHQLYKLKSTPNGRKLWTYMAAILEVTGMAQGKVYPLNKFMGNFKTHLDNNRIVRADGGYRLTPTGIDYFNDRYNSGSRQHIERSDVKIMVHTMTSGVNDEWIKVI